MNDLAKLPPTRATLLRLERELREAQQGHAMLERKREVLLRELWGLLRDIEHSEQQIRERFAAAYRAMRAARLEMGSERLRWASLAPAARARYQLELRSVMGVTLPMVQLDITPLPLPYSPWGVSVRFDEARRRWLEAAEQLGSWVEAVGSVWRLAAELERTQRRVRALENLLIPATQAAIARIRAVLEEQEREGFVRAKRIKGQLEGEHEGARGNETG